MVDHKDRIEKAMLAYHERQLKPARTNKRKNKAPEKDVEKEVLKWLRANKFSVNVIEAKGGYNNYGAITVKSGYSDISGNDKNGFAIFIELKAKGKRATLREHQRQFLYNKVNSQAFACCVDSVDLLEHLYNSWVFYKLSGSNDKARCFLMESFPKGRVKNFDPIF